MEIFGDSNRLLRVTISMGTDFPFEWPLLEKKKGKGMLFVQMSRESVVDANDISPHLRLKAPLFNLIDTF